MARGIAIAANTTTPEQYNGAATNYLVRDNNSRLWLVFIDRQFDVYVTSSTDDGLTWANPTLMFTGTAVALSVWYGRWSGVADDKIYVVYTESGGSDILF